MLTRIVWISCIAQKRTDCQTELSPQKSSHISFSDVLYKSSTRGRRQHGSRPKVARLAAGGSSTRDRRQHDSRPKVVLLAAASSQHLILPSEAAPLSLFFFTTFYPSQPNLASFSLGFVKSRRLRCLFFFVLVFVAAPSPSLYRLEILKKPLPRL